MDLPALQRSINDLENSLDGLSFWLFLTTGLVVLGLILEYWHEIPEAITSLKQRWSWKPLLVLVGGIFITLGVAGELIVQHFASRTETKLRTSNDAVFALLDTDAAKARKEADEAAERASEADERAAKNEKEAAQLRKTAEDERLARLKIEENVAWRTLTNEQQAEMAGRLKVFSRQMALIQFNANDIEAGAFGRVVASALQLAEWRVSEPQAVLMLPEGPVPLGTNSSPQTGVTVASTLDRDSRRAADALVHELVRHGFSCIGAAGTVEHGSLVLIFFQHRPEGPQGKAALAKEPGK